MPTPSPSAHVTARAPQPPPRSAAVTAASPRRLLELHGPWILHLSASLARRSGLPEADAADFGGWVALRLMSKDFALLEACRHPDRLRGFLRALIINLLKDYRNHLWGKWRPSSTAQCLGESAVELEKMCHRDGLALREAIEILRSRRPDAGRDQLEELGAKLPMRQRRTFVPLDTRRAPQAPRAQDRLLAAETEKVRGKVRKILLQARQILDELELRILELHYQEGQSFAGIARRNGIDQRSLYSRKDRALKKLRGLFEAQGLSQADVLEAFGASCGDLSDGPDTLFPFDYSMKLSISTDVSAQILHH